MFLLEQNLFGRRMSDRISFTLFYPILCKKKQFLGPLFTGANKFERESQVRVAEQAMSRQSPNPFAAHAFGSSADSNSVSSSEKTGKPES